jgi:hypothetical protein
VYEEIIPNSQRIIKTMASVSSIALSSLCLNHAILALPCFPAEGGNEKAQFAWIEMNGDSFCSNFGLCGMRGLVKQSAKKKRNGFVCQWGK